LVVAAALAASGCASASGARPAAFPRAPLPPAALQPAGLAPASVPSVPDVVQTAYALRGIDYRLGGDLPSDGFDCSGFVRYVFLRNRIDVPRTVSEQFATGAEIDADEVQVGDLVFFSTIAPGASHVGLVVGPETFIHAPGAGGVVRVERFNTPYWQRRMVGARRVM
jgi:cell wall-associated NlpC family hydrolase